ncbi:MAG: PKD domain-containing protein, partial [Bacteroidota bacterium]|nr:PKD domain-containing protein [Bacteroidota bacterium]
GQATVHAEGGTLPYTYLWNNGQTTQTATNLPVGTYEVTVTDQNGCSIVVNSINITEPSTLSATATVDKTIDCNGNNNGQATVHAEGGTLPYTYLWNDGQIDSTGINLTAGTYTVTVTDKNTCTVIVSVVITEPSNSLMVTAFKINDVLCNGESTGKAYAITTGGTGTYKYKWSEFSQTDTITDLSAGKYLVTVTDDNKCTDSASVIIKQPNSLNAQPIRVNVNCYGQKTGSIDMLVSGGTIPYKYLWSDGETTKVINNLNAGNYTVTITDNNNCTDTMSITIDQPPYPPLTVSMTKTDIACFGENTGKISLNVIGGIQPYKYQWSNNEKVKDIDSLSAGVYNVVVIDNNGCDTNATVTLIQAPTPLVMTSNSTMPKCFGSVNGNIDLTVSGGIPPYNYLWSNGKTTHFIDSLSEGSYTVTVTDSNTCSKSKNIILSQPDSLSLIPNATDVSCYGENTGNIKLKVTGGTLQYNYSWSNSRTDTAIYKLPAGKYRVTVTDKNNCTITDQITISEPPPLDANFNKKDVTCYGEKTGYINAIAQGGTPPYIYLWSNNIQSQNIEYLSEGTYTVTITDKKGCHINKSLTISEPDSIIAQFTSGNLKCNGDKNGWIQIVKVIGGVGNYRYKWNTNVKDTLNIIDSLSEGTYTVTITDKNNCNVINSEFITAPLPLKLKISGDTLICPNSTSKLFAAGSGGTKFSGNEEYIYRWNNIPQSISYQAVVVSKDTSYNVFIEDSNGCHSSTQTIRISIYKQINLNLILSSVQDTFCIGTPVTINALATEGNGKYSYKWSNGSIFQSITVSPSVKTIYKVTVTDNCTQPVDIADTINVYPKTNISLTADNASGCPPLDVNFNTNNKNINSYQWDFGDPQSGAENYAGTSSPSHLYYNSGVYNVSVTYTDNNGCKFLYPANSLVNVYPKPTADFKTDPSVIDMSNSVVNFIDLSNEAIKWSWNFGDSIFDPKNNTSRLENPVHEYKKAGVYNVKLAVKNYYDCYDTIVKTLFLKEKYKFYVPNTFTPNEDGTNDLFMPVGNLIFNGNFELYIFNRWGQEIYSTFDVSKPWNGKYHGTGEMVQDGVYVWLLILHNIEGKEERHYGNVNVIH